jgi:predicted Zn-dependent peptidase
MRMNRLGRSVVTDTEILPIEEIIARVEAVSSQDVQDLADEYWQPESFSLAAIGPDADIVRTAVERFAPSLAAP